MNNRRFPLLLVSLAFTAASTLAAEEATDDNAKDFSFEVKKGISAHVRLVWRDTFLRGIEIGAERGAPARQKIRVGEGETIWCDLNRESLPPNWIGATDYNKDGYKDIYLQSAQGTSPSYTVLLYEPKNKRFAVTKSLSGVQGLRINTSGEAPAAKPAGRKLADSFGVVTKMANENGKLSIGGPELKKGDLVEVVPYDEQQTIYTAEIVEKLGRDDAGGGTNYSLEFMSRIGDETILLGTGVLGAPDGVEAVDGKARVRLGSRPAEKPLTFRACTSSEGVHLTVWSGKPLKGKRVWHAYHALGYDVEANCTPKDYASTE